MRLETIFVCVLATCGPLLVTGQKKMIFVIPRTVQRAHSLPWRHFTRSPFTKDTKFPDTGFLPLQRSHTFPNSKFTKDKPIYFTQNHLLTDAPGPPEHTEHNHLNYYSHPEVTQQMDNYLQRDEVANQQDIQERRTDNQRAEKFPSKTLGEPFNRVIYEISKKPHFSSESLYNEDKSILTAGGISDATFGGNKEGIVLRDNIDLSDYYKKFMESASTWRSGLHTSLGSDLSTAVSHGNIPGIGATSQQRSGFFQSNNFGGFNILSSNPLVSQQGYAVQENVEDVMPHDFRTQPIQTAPIPNPQDIQQAGVPRTEYANPSASFMPSLQFPGPQEFRIGSGHL